VTVAPALARIPRGIWVLGVVSLLMDASSELVHALLPLFMVTTLGASTFVVGVVEGIAESIALVMRVFSGYFSDAVGRRKPVVLVGYGLGALSKLVFPLAPALGWVVGARFIDRVGKGIRGAPRDALMADLAPAELRGASFGLRQALDSVGAIAGPLLAVLAMVAFANDFRAAFWVAVVPAALCVALIVFGVHEPDRHDRPAGESDSLSLRDVGRLDRRFWFITGVAAVLTLARFSEAFLVLRGQSVGMNLASVPWVMVVMSAVYALLAFPAGAWADQGNSGRLISLGLLALVASDLVLAQAATPGGVLAGAALWGVHMALTQGLLSALVAAVAPADLRGTAFGFFSLASGVALLFASALAGWLWDAAGPRFTFYAGAVFTVLAWIGLLVRRRDLPLLSGGRTT
jgi:MFS family permease